MQDYKIFMDMETLSLLRFKMRDEQKVYNNHMTQYSFGFWVQYKLFSVIKYIK